MTILLRLSPDLNVTGIIDLNVDDIRIAADRTVFDVLLTRSR